MDSNDRHFDPAYFVGKGRHCFKCGDPQRPGSPGLPIPDFLGATTLISKMDAKGAFLKSPLDYTFTLQNVAPGTLWSLTVVDGQTGEIIGGDLSALHASDVESRTL